MTTHGMEITFGIEIECAIPSEHASGNFRQGGYHRGLQITEAPRGWNCQRDGSVHAMTAGYTPVEIVSPILSGLDGLSQACYMAEYLNDVSAEFNRSGGMHIHVGIPAEKRNSQIFLNRLHRLFTRYEKAFFALNGDKVNERYYNNFCKRWNGNATNALRGDRYMALNLNNLFTSKGTVEFRLFAGTGDVEQIITAAYMCVALVSAALDETIDIEDRFNYYTTPKNAVNNFIRKIFAHNSVRIVPDSPIDEVIDHLTGQFHAADAIWA